MTKCQGCGITLQNKDKTKEGYVKDLTKKYCERCFKIKNYNEYTYIDKDNKYYLNNLKEIEKTNSLVLIVTDLLNISLFNKIKIKNPHINIITKQDIVPRSFNLDKLINNYILVGAKNNYNLDELMNKIKEKQTNKNVYVVGYTNTGKSTLINKIAKNYGKGANITSSPLPSTTLDLIKIKITDDLTLIDTPGLINEGSYYEIKDKKILKKITPKVEIKPRTYQIKKAQTILLDDLIRLDIKEKTNITFYISNTIKIKRTFKETHELENLRKVDLNLKGYIFINGLGFIYIKNKTNLTLYIDKTIKFSLKTN